MLPDVLLIRGTFVVFAPVSPLSVRYTLPVVVERPLAHIDDRVTYLVMPSSWALGLYI